MTFELEDFQKHIKDNPILLYMKGSPQLPQCGFSAQTVEIMMKCGKKFAFVDVLTNPDIRKNLPNFAQWPTFPQLWINGELIGGCDIIKQMFADGQLQALLDSIE